MNVPVETPRQTPPAHGVERRPERVASRPAAPTVLVVEDDPHLRDMLRLALELDGYQVKEASDGYRALGQVEHEQPDVVLLDLMLPGLDGLSVVRALGERGLHGQVPVILMSASGLSEQAAARAGAAAFLNKPFDVRRLLAEIERQVGR